MPVDEMQPNDNDNDSPRKNSARERHNRRRERQTGMAAPATSGLPRSPRPSRQIRPAGGFKMPEIRIPANRNVLYAVGGGIFILLVVLALGRFKNDVVEADPNAIWLGTEWTYDQPDEATILALVERLRDNRIGSVYAWVSLLQPTGTWTDTIRFNAVREFTTQLRAAYPELEIYGWLSIGAQAEDGSNRLNNPAVQQTIADISEQVVNELGFDGVMLNVGPVLNGDEGYLALLRQIRAAIGETAPLSVAVPPDWTPPGESIVMPPGIAPSTIWETEYKQRVALLADQMIVTVYNSGYTSAADYSAWTAYQVRVFADSIAALQSGTDVLISIPTYDPDLPRHDPAVENIVSAVNGIRAGLSQAGSAATSIQGVAIYAEWTTDATEWTQFKSLWVDG